MAHVITIADPQSQYEQDGAKSEERSDVARKEKKKEQQETNNRPKNGQP